MNQFIPNLKTTLENQYHLTENGAIGYRTTGKNLLDLNFAVASLRNATENEILQKFIKAYYEDPKLAIKWLFFARDVRQGLGERRFFRTVFTYLVENQKGLPLAELMMLIPEYGRFDDLWILLETSQRDALIAQIESQLNTDMKSMMEQKPISLLAKWLPSINTSSEETKTQARMIAKSLKMTEKEYRKTLSSLRAYLDVVERKMSAKEFDQINYETVPSRANLIYSNAFQRQDEARRTSYLAKLQNGEAKINAKALFPHEIVNAYTAGGQWRLYNEADQTLELLWDNLGEIGLNLGNSIVVADTSLSMTVPVDGGTTTALSVCFALAIYFAERSSGMFKDHFITFSANPQLVDLSQGQTLRDKLQILFAHNEAANTDIAKVFRLILQTAIDHHMKQKDLPKNIVIISDMEFDGCVENANDTLFNILAAEFKQEGYVLPRLIFWNVNSRTGTIPVKENQLGVALVSGFSVQVLQTLLSGKLDPYECLLELLNDKRYDAVSEVLEEM